MEYCKRNLDFDTARKCLDLYNRYRKEEKINDLEKTVCEILNSLIREDKNEHYKYHSGTNPYFSIVINKKTYKLLEKFVLDKIAHSKKIKGGKR